TSTVLGMKLTSMVTDFIFIMAMSYSLNTGLGLSWPLAAAAVDDSGDPLELLPQADEFKLVANLLQEVSCLRHGRAELIELDLHGLLYKVADSFLPGGFDSPGLLAGYEDETKAIRRDNRLGAPWSQG